MDAKYRVVDTLGGGAMSTVYSAVRLEDDAEVALKVLHPWILDRKRAIDRLFREARTIAELDHPGCVRLYEWGVDGKHPYLVLELMRGSSLDKLIDRQAPLPVERVIGIAIQLCDVLEAAHLLGVVHRDLKPENIMLKQEGVDIVKVLDFGVARLMPDARGEDETIPRELTQPGSMLGTPTHMAPEQMKGMAADPRTDIYALGVVLYEMLTRELPIVANNPIATLMLLNSKIPDPPSSHVPSLPPAIDFIVMRCLEKERDKRWQTAAEVRAHLQTFLEAPAELDRMIDTLRSAEVTAPDSEATVRRMAPAPQRPVQSVTVKMADLPPVSAHPLGPTESADHNIQAGWPVVVGVALIAIAVIIIMFVVTR